MTPQQVLAGARDILAEGGWWRPGSQGGLCLMVAVGRAVPPGEEWVLGRCFEAIREVCESPSVAAWNDRPGRTYEDVVLALKQAEALLDEREVSA
jgi:hypothetical protein